MPSSYRESVGGSEDYKSYLCRRRREIKIATEEVAGGETVELCRNHIAAVERNYCQLIYDWRCPANLLDR